MRPTSKDPYGRYAETKILNILELLVADHKVNKGEEPGRATYKWAVEAI